MFFFLSKILDFVFSPLTWIFVIFLLSLLTKKANLRRKLLIAGLIVFYFFSNRFISYQALRLWEPSAGNIEEVRGVYDAAIVLGGGMVTLDAQKNQPTFRHNTDRFLQALRLYKAGKVKKIVISGGSGSLIYRDMKEAAMLRQSLIELGYPAGDIWAEDQSDNTYQNAVYTTKLLNDSLPGGRFLLITSASHMPRSKACFIKTGMKFDTFAVEPVTGTMPVSWSFYVLPDIDALYQWNKLVHEIWGYVIYAIFGYL